MKINFKAALNCSALLLFASIASAQTYNDGPMELKIRVVEVRVDYHPDDNVSNDFTLSGSINSIIGNFINVPSLATDEITCKVWARDNVGSGWQGGQCLLGDLPMANGGPESYTPNPAFNDLVFTYPGQQVPGFFDLRLEAWEDEKPGDFDALPGGVPFVLTNDCQSADGWSRCNFDGTQTPCVTLFGAGVLDMEDDIHCDANPFQTNMDYRAAGPPCKWNDMGWTTGTCPQNNYYQVRVQSYYRFTAGSACSNAFDLGTLTPGSGAILSHYNSNECYSNTLAGSRPGNDVYYKFHINNPIGIDVNLCNSGTLFDTYVYLLDANCTIIDFNDDGAGPGCGTRSLISKSLCVPGDYYVVVDGKDANAIGAFRINITENTSFTFAATISKTDPTCNGRADGKAEVNVTGGVSPYTYSWSNGFQDTLNTGLLANTYSVTVTDQSGCGTTATTTLIDPPALVIDNLVTTDLTCSGQNDGTAQVFVSGGTPPYINFIWNNGMQGDSIFGLQAGTYTVTVSDIKGCTVTNAGSGTGTVSANNPIVITLDSLANVRCNGQNNGAIYVKVTGGVPGYTYHWTPNVSTDSFATNLSPRQYDLTVYDATAGGNLCFETATFSITEPEVLVSTIAGIRNVTCFGGDDGGVDLEVSGGTRPYSYLWSDGSTRGDLLGSVADTVSVVVRDANGCTASSDTVLTQPTEINPTITKVSDAGCYGASGGALNLEVTGGTPNYSYYWAPNGETTQDLTGLAAGNYSVVITDAEGCVKVANATVDETTELVVYPEVSNVSCIGKKDGRINLVASGASPFTYLWSNNSTSQEIRDLDVGSYSATVTDANGCTAEISGSITEAITSCGVIKDVVIPNVFTPNGDDRNSTFDIFRPEDVSKVSVRIYDRWGSKVYDNPNQESGTGKGWDGKVHGKDGQPGVYTYVMEIEYSTPNTTDRPTQKTGTVTLLR